MRDELIAAVTAHLKHVEATRDFRLALDRHVQDVARRLEENCSDYDVQANYALGWLYWYTYLALPEGQDGDAFERAGHHLLACFVAGLEKLPERLLPTLAQHAMATAVRSCQQAETSTDLTEITAAVRLWQRIVAAFPDDHPERAGLLSYLSNVLQIRFERTGAVDDLDAAIEAGQDLLQILPVSHPERVKMLSNHGISLQHRFECTGSMTDLETSVDIFREAVAITPRDQPIRAVMLFNLGGALQNRFRRTGVPADQDAAVTSLQEAVTTIQHDHPDRFKALSNLGNALRGRFERTGTSADLNAAVDTFQEAIAAAPANHTRIVVLSNLGIALQDRFARTGTTSDLDASVSHLQEAVSALPEDHPNRVLVLANLGNALRARFERTGARADLDAAVDAGQRAVEVLPPDHPERAKNLSNYGVSLQYRFGCTGAMSDLEAAVANLRKAVTATPLDHLNRTMLLSNLGTALQDRFNRTGAISDLDAAVEAFQEAEQATPSEHPDRSKYLLNLGNALRDRFERTGVTSDLDAAVDAGQRTVKALPHDDTGRVKALTNLGRALQTRFERTGETGDLDAAIDVGQQAVAAAPSDHSERVKTLTNLCAALQYRFERVGAMSDLDAVVASLLEAVAATSSEHPEWVFVQSNLSVALRARFERTGTIDDLDAAVNAGQQALAVIPADHSIRTTILTNLGIALQARFEHTGATSDLDAAIDAGQQAVASTPADHPGRATALINLGNTLRDRFGHSSVPSNLNAAVSVFRDAAATIPSDHPHRVAILANLGSSLLDRFRCTGAQEDLDEAEAVLAQAVEMGSAAPSVRVQTTRTAAALAAARSDPAGAADLFEVAVRLLSETVPRQLGRGDQQYALGQYAGLASDAAALALAAPEGPLGERAVRALGLLELGRGVMLGQALDMRTDLTDLQVRYPELAARFTELRDRLDDPADSDFLRLRDVEAVTSGGSSSVADRHRVAAAFEQTLEEIRAQEGFEGFLLPPSAEQLVGHAEQGPVVVVNVSGYRSDALLLTREGITSVALPGVTEDVLAGWVEGCQQALAAVCGPDGSPRQRSRAQHRLHAVLEWLWDAVAGPVLDALGYHNPPDSGADWPHVWWAPGGLLNSLPIHAAGYHREHPADGRRTVLDRVVSSYTPTVRALGYARERDATVPTDQRALVVAMPTTPGEEPLHHVTREVDLLRTRLPRSVVLTEDPTTPGTRTPTRTAVLDRLDDCAVAHFACHGTTHPRDPSQSQLLLHDHASDPFTVAGLSSLRLEQARLAYLSACRTAVNPATELRDEAIHLTTAFQLAGYPHVVGTLWEINDAVAVRVTDAFYAALAADDTTVDTSRAAQALHHAIRGLRDELPATPSLWAAHLHTGA